MPNQQITFCSSIMIPVKAWWINNLNKVKGRSLKGNRVTTLQLAIMNNITVHMLVATRHSSRVQLWPRKIRWTMKCNQIHTVFRILHLNKPTSIKVLSPFQQLWSWTSLSPSKNIPPQSLQQITLTHMAALAALPPSPEVWTSVCNQLQRHQVTTTTTTLTATTFGINSTADHHPLWLI